MCMAMQILGKSKFKTDTPIFIFNWNLRNSYLEHLRILLFTDIKVFQQNAKELGILKIIQDLLGC